jgi:8-oxo-dGTP pyrophosphatase MutT (NUDIX family)
MEVDGPEPGTALNTSGEAVTPRQAATIILLRGGAEALEVLLVQRNPNARFMAGVWVFPGGAVDAHEGEGDEAHRAAAVRELAEEAAVEGLDPAALTKFSRWITPAEVSVRFDTHFFLARAPDGTEPRVDGSECVDLGWFTPRAALDAHEAGELLLVFPTIKHLEQIARFASVEELLAHSAGREVVAVEPQLIVTGETARIVLPGEPGYEE